jgi:hypothetical protein
LVEVEIDQNDPLLPPKVKAKEAINLMKALIKGTPGREEIAAHIVQDAREMI